MEHLTKENLLPFARKLYDKGTRETILEFLQWFDPEGCYTDTECRSQGFSLFSYDESLLELEDVITDLTASKLELEFSR